MVKYSDQKYSVYRCTFVMQPRQHQSSEAQKPSIRNAQEKAKRKGGKERHKGAKMRDQIAKKKTNKKTSPCAYILPPWPLRHDLSWVYNFDSAWLWRTTYLLSFLNKLFFYQLLMLDSRGKYPAHFGCIFQNPRPNDMWRLFRHCWFPHLSFF